MARLQILEDEAPKITRDELRAFIAVGRVLARAIDSKLGVDEYDDKYTNDIAVNEAGDLLVYDIDGDLYKRFDGSDYEALIRWINSSGA